MPIKDVADAVREMKAGSTHIKTRPQAIAVGLQAQRKAGKRVPQVRQSSGRGR
jgi:hypothetical protein